MLPHQWETFKRAARLEKLDRIPMAMIIDSPWIPGYLGIQHLDYFLDPELWFESNLKIMKEFPANGFKLVEEFDELPWQHLMFFQRDDAE